MVLLINSLFYWSYVFLFFSIQSDEIQQSLQLLAVCPGFSWMASHKTEIDLAPGILYNGRNQILGGGTDSRAFFALR